MASELRVNTLKDAAGNNSVGMEYVANGSAKAYVQFDGDAGTPAANKSLNHSSITDNGTGDYSVTVSNAFDGVDYGVVITGGRSGDGAANNGGDMSLDTGSGGTAPTSTTTRMNSWRNTNTSAESANDVPNITEVRYGDLA